MLLLVGVLLAIGSTRSGGPLTQQDRIDSISKKLACPTCSGESVYSSRATAAESIRTEVARQVGSGIRSDDEIITFIAQRFGGQVLLVPRATGLDALVWALPAAALVISASFLVGMFARWNRNKPKAPTTEDEKLVNRALAQETTKQDD